MRALVDPVDGMPAAVVARRWVWPLLLLMVAVSAAQASVALRWQAAPGVIRELQAAGELENVTEQELVEKITLAGRVELVQGVALGLFVVPLLVLALALVLKIAGWLFASPAPLGRCLAASSLATLPLSLHHVILAVCALAQPQLADGEAASLVPSSLASLLPAPSSPALVTVLGSLEFFQLWTVALLGLGFAAASGMRRGRALLLSFTLYAMFTGVWRIGLPGLLAGGGA